VSTDSASGDAQARSDLIAAIEKALQASGFHAEHSGVIQGASGAKHVFDFIVATAAGQRVVIDVRTSHNGRIQLRELMETYAKSLDANARPAVMVNVPGVSPEARKSAAAFGVVLIEGNSASEVIERLDSVLRRGPG
jgi:hypothetical protein